MKISLPLLFLFLNFGSYSSQASENPLKCTPKQVKTWTKGEFVGTDYKGIDIQIPVEVTEKNFITLKETKSHTTIKVSLNVTSFYDLREPNRNFNRAIWSSVVSEFIKSDNEPSINPPTFPFYNNSNFEGIYGSYIFSEWSRQRYDIGKVSEAFHANIDGRIFEGSLIFDTVHMRQCQKYNELNGEPGYGNCLVSATVNLIDPFKCNFAQ